jgi:hypothetical protein
VLASGTIDQSLFNAYVESAVLSKADVFESDLKHLRAALQTYTPKPGTSPQEASLLKTTARTDLPLVVSYLNCLPEFAAAGLPRAVFGCLVQPSIGATLFNALGGESGFAVSFAIDPIGAFLGELGDLGVEVANTFLTVGVDMTLRTSTAGIYAISSTEVALRVARSGPDEYRWVGVTESLLASPFQGKNSSNLA